MKWMLCFVLLICSGISAQEEPGQPTVVAEKAFYARDWKAAASAYTKVVAKDPTDGTAWYRLGYALHAQGKLDEALEAHVAASNLESRFRPTATFNAACVHALQGRKDQAFTWLDRAIAAGFDQVEHAKSDADLESLRLDARYISMLKRMGEAADVTRRMREAASKKHRKVAIFIHDGVELLDFAGPGEVFSNSRDSSGMGFEVYTVGKSTEPITSQRFLTVTPQYGFDDCPQPDIIVIPGGSTRRAIENTKVVEWVEKAAPQAEVVMSVCTGAFILLDARLLDGKFATTHFSAVDGLIAKATKTEVLRDARIVDNGKVVTTAGISAGIDGALYLVGRVIGTESARNTARGMQYRWNPDELSIFVAKGQTPKSSTAVAVPERAVKGGPVWRCPPCDRPCDKVDFGEAGKCPGCGMRLVKQAGAPKTTATDRGK